MEMKQAKTARRKYESSSPFRAHETVRRFLDLTRSFRQSGGLPEDPPEPDGQGGEGSDDKEELISDSPSHATEREIVESRALLRTKLEPIPQAYSRVSLMEEQLLVDAWSFGLLIKRICLNGQVWHFKSDRRKSAKGLRI